MSVVGDEGLVFALLADNQVGSSDPGMNDLNEIITRPEFILPVLAIVAVTVVALRMTAVNRKHDGLTPGSHLQRVERYDEDRKSTRLNSSHIQKSRMPSSA